MHPGCYRYITGTNIEVGVRKLSANLRTRFKKDNIVCTSIRMCRLYTPFERKNKNNLIDAGDYIIQQHMPVEILQEKSDFTLKGTPGYNLKSYIKTIVYVDRKPGIFIDNELQWTTLDIDDPCYHKQSYRTMKDGENVYMHRYNRKPTSWEYIKHCRYLYVHGLKQLRYPIHSVTNNIVTFNTNPVKKAHVAVCRTKPTKVHLFCRLRMSTKGYSTLGCNWFNEGFVKDTTIFVHVLREDDKWVLCFLQYNYTGDLVWLPTNLIQQTRPDIPMNEEGDSQHTYIHGRIPTHVKGTKVLYTNLGWCIWAHRHTMRQTRIEDTPEHKRIKQEVMNDIRQRQILNKSQVSGAG